MSPPPTPRGAARPALREWLLLGAAALVPSLGLGALGLRALRNEEAAVRREASLEVAAAADRAAAAENAEIAAATEALSRADFDDAPGKAPAPSAWMERASTIAPASGAAIVVSPQGALIAPTAESGVGADRTDPACTGASTTLATASGEAREGAVGTILERCTEARTELGRFLWPTLALAKLATARDDGLEKRLLAFVRTHAAAMRASERAATLAEIRALETVDADTKEQLARALEGAAGRTEILARALRSGPAERALRAMKGESTTFRGGGAVGALRPLATGHSVGFLVTPETLEESLRAAPTRFGASEGITVRVVARDAPTRVAGAAPDATVWLADGIGFRAELTHPEALAARAQRSEALLVAIAVACAAAAVGLSLTWFSRARAARRTGELRTSFVAAVSHELRTPIASVRMLAELLEEDRVDEAERAEVHEALAREARRLGETVDRLLGFSRMAAGKVVLDRATIPLADPVERAVERFRDRCPEQAVECELDRSVVAFVDPAQVELVVDNLLGNAKKYAPLGTPYRVKVDADGAYARLTITDRGPGIPRRDQRRIFEPFERVDDRLSKATEGSGIGLSLVAHAARAHGGGAWVESDEGRGATFVVTFPRAEGAPARRADARADEEASDAEDDDIESEDGRGDA